MKLARSLSSDRRARQATGGFTLAELMIAMTVFIFLLGGVIFANLYGLSMFKLTETKLNATDDARKVVGKFANEVRACEGAYVGNVNSGVFTTLAPGAKQQGTGVLLSNSTGGIVIYFLNTADKTLRRTAGTPGSAVVLAESVTNLVPFQMQDHLGNVLTNNQINRVIHFTMEFYQPRRRLGIADYYKVETSATRRKTDQL